MIKYLISLSAALLLLNSCGQNNTASDHPAYHNPLVQPYTDSIADDPEHAEFYFRRADVLTQVHNDSLALLDVQKALSLDKENPQYTYTVGYLQLQLGQVKAAIKTLQHNLEQSPGNVSTRMLLSKAFLADGDSDGAQEQISKILAASPKHPGAMMIMADIKAAAKDTLASIAILKELLVADPRNREASYDLADWYKATGNAAATVQYEYTYNLDTTDVNPLFEIGEHYEQLKQTQKAIEAYVVCMSKDRDFTPAYIQLGKIYMGQGDNAKALRHFNLAIQTAPNNAEAYYYKGLCFSKLAQRDSAVVALNQALVFDRGMSEAAVELKKLRK